MATGTGLPVLKSGDVRTQPAQIIDSDALVSAAAWKSIAQTGAAVGKDISNLARLEVHQQQSGYLADQELEINDTRTKLRDEHANEPERFKNAWDTYTESKISGSEPWAVNQIKRHLGSQGNAAYGAILGERRSTDERIAGERLTTLATSASSDYVGSAMSGQPDPAKLEKFKAVVASAVTARLMSPEKAELLIDETAGRAQGEIAARNGVDVYKAQGYDAAVGHLQREVLENETLGLKPAEKRRAFNRGLEAINLQRRVDREDRVGIIEDVKDTVARIKSNQPVEIGVVREQMAAAKRVGAWSAYRDLYVEQQVGDLMAPYRTGAVRPAEIAKTIGAARERAMTVAGTPERAGAISAASTRLGINPRDLAAAISYETSGTFNPDIQGGKGNNHVGLIQFGPEERAKYGVRPGMTFEQQMGAVENFLRDRGLKPGSGLPEIYRTINGGNPNASLSASDGNGTIAEHIGKIQQAHYGNADKFLGGTATATDAPAGDFAGTIVKRAQGEFSTQMRKEWPEFKKLIDAGKDVDAEDFNAVRMAAAVSGDAAWIKDVEDAYQARILGKVIGAAPVGQQQAALDEVGQKFNATVAKSVNDQLTRRLKLVTEDPVGFSVENGRAPPAPITFGDPRAIMAAVQERVNIARAVAQDQQVAPANPFRPAETAAIAGAITSGKPEQASAALSAIGSLPDDMLVPALKNSELRSAITGASRSADPVRFSAAMQFADALWQRAPETAKTVLGEDNIHQLMTWQANLRYMTPDVLAKERERANLDPQVRTRQKANEQEGLKLARKLDVGEVVKQFDTSWLPFTGPGAPADAQTRDALMGDYESIFARRYADTLDADKAKEQTLALLKTKWQRSEVNGGKLMLRAPETAYPAINGTHDWMKTQLETDLSTQLGARFENEAGAAANWDYNVVSDRRTESEAQAGRPPSYVVVVTDRRTGKSDVVRREDGTEMRYAWDAGPEQEKARIDFAAERQRVLNPPKGIARNMPGIN
jgi:hypothetical protein